MPTQEVMLDIEIIGTSAPKATIRVGFASFTAAGYVDALSRRPMIMSR